MTIRGSWKIALLLFPLLGALVAISWIPAIPQDPGYHHFADTRRMAGIPNAWNVLSNLPFILVGVWGVMRLPHGAKGIWLSYAAFSSSLIFVGLGSGYYHVEPTTSSLVWDRLPMTMGFMSLMALAVADRMNPRWERPLLFLLLVLGASSVAYWAWTEHLGHGDLRPYGLVQFLPMVMLPLLVILYPHGALHRGWLLGAVAAYGLAKAMELFDAPLLHTTGIFAGHAVKHFFAAVATWCVLVSVPRTLFVSTRNL